MHILQIEHRVNDFDTWKQAFDSDPVGRQQGGVRRYRVLRPTDDPNHVIVDLEFPRLGLIRVDAADQALADLRASMK